MAATTAERTAGPEAPAGSTESSRTGPPQDSRPKIGAIFRGLLLPRMNGAFGRFDWVANGALFALYHVHVPWTIPAVLLDSFFLSYPAKRYRSALISILAHSAQSAVILALATALVVAP